MTGTITVNTLYTAEELARRNTELAAEIARVEYDRLLVVAILSGSFVFAADLIRSLHEAGMAPEIEFLQLSSYRSGMASSGQVEIVRDLDSDVRGRDVLLIDDNLESGRTLAYAKDLIAARGATRVFSCVLLEKPGLRAVQIDADFIGFDCPDKFVVGYGMDVAHAYRQLPYVGVVEREET
jgi:hypoxanthine phosphoribosyltransferase